MDTLIEIATNLQKVPDKLLKPFCWKSQTGYKTFRFFHQSIFLIKMTLWRGRMQFLQPRRKVFNIRSKKIAQCTKMIKNYSLFEKIFLWSVFMCTKKAVVTFSPINIRRKAKKLSLTVPKWKIKFLFFTKIFFEKKHSYGHVESSFRHVADSLQSFDKTPKHSAQGLKKISDHFFFKKLIFRKYVLLETLKAVVTIPPKSFRQGAKTNSLNIWNCQNKYTSFINKKFFTKLMASILRMQF